MAYRLDQTKEDAIYDFIKAIVGSSVSVIWEEQGEDRPSKPYVSLCIISGPTKIGNRAEMTYKETDTYTRYFQKKFTLSISVFANNNDSYIINNIQNSLYLEDKLNILRSGGISVWNQIGPSNISRVIDDDWEYRSHLDAIMSYGENIDDITGEIRKVEINGQIIDTE